MNDDGTNLIAMMKASNRIRVLMVVPCFPPPVTGGVGRQASLLAKALVREGHQVTVVGRRFRPDQKAREVIDGIEVIRLCFPIRILDEVYQILFPLFLMSRRNDFDIVHIHTIRLFGYEALAMAKFIGKKTLMKIPIIGSSGIPGLGCKLADRIRRTILRFSDSVVALTKTTYDELIRLGYPAQRIFRIVNGVGADIEFQTGGGEDSEAVHVVFSGRWVPEKGLADLLSAWEILQSLPIAKSIRLSIYGAGPMERPMKEAILQKSLSDSVTLCGHRDNVREILRGADLFVLPSCMEGVSNAILEAMSAGLPIISTTLGGTLNLVGEAGRQFLHDPGDVEGLSKILLTLIDDRNLRMEIGNRMRERAQLHFSIESIKDQYVRAYRLIIDGKWNGIGDCSDFPPN